MNLWYGLSSSPKWNRLNFATQFFRETQEHKDINANAHLGNSLILSMSKLFPWEGKWACFVNNWSVIELRLYIRLLDSSCIWLFTILLSVTVIVSTSFPFLSSTPMWLRCWCVRHWFETKQSFVSFSKFLFCLWFQSLSWSRHSSPNA